MSFTVTHNTDELLENVKATVPKKEIDNFTNCHVVSKHHDKTVVITFDRQQFDIYLMYYSGMFSTFSRLTTSDNQFLDLPIPAFGLTSHTAGFKKTNDVKISTSLNFSKEIPEYPKYAVNIVGGSSHVNQSNLYTYMVRFVAHSFIRDVQHNRYSSEPFKTFCDDSVDENGLIPGQKMNVQGVFVKHSYENGSNPVCPIIATLYIDDVLTEYFADNMRSNRNVNPHMADVIIDNMVYIPISPNVNCEAIVAFEQCHVVFKFHNLKHSKIRCDYYWVVNTSL